MFTSKKVYFKNNIWNHILTTLKVGSKFGVRA